HALPVEASSNLAAAMVYRRRSRRRQCRMTDSWDRCSLTRLAATDPPTTRPTPDQAPRRLQRVLPRPRFRYSSWPRVHRARHPRPQALLMWALALPPGRLAVRRLAGLRAVLAARRQIPGAAQ